MGRLSKRGSIRAYEQSLDDLTRSVKENGKSLDIDTQKGRDNQEALDAIADQRPRTEHFGYSPEDAFAVGLTCGGELDVHLQPVKATTKDDGGARLGDLLPRLAAYACRPEGVTWMSEPMWVAASADSSISVVDSDSSRSNGDSATSCRHRTRSGSRATSASAPSSVRPSTRTSRDEKSNLTKATACCSPLRTYSSTPDRSPLDSL
mgnify:CR=1 FL=1